MKKIWTAVTAATMILAAGAAQAADESAIYGAVGVGMADGDHAAYKRDGSQLSVGYSLGYRFNENYGVEVFTRALEFKMIGLRRDFEYPDSHVGVAAVGRLPVAKMLSLSARVGLGRTKMSREDGVNPSDKTTFSAGVGAALEFGRNVALTTGVERYAGINTSVWLINWQLSY